MDNNIENAAKHRGEENEELLDIVDENGEPTGLTASRGEAHSRGLRHRTTHLWLIRKRGGHIQLLLQKRSREKDSYPGCFDISSAGHIPAGCGYTGSAVRELKEELGIDASPDSFVLIGRRRFEFSSEFHGSVFHDNQVSNVYAMWYDGDEDTFAPQSSEVEYVKWVDMDECAAFVADGSVPNCINQEELDMISTFVKQNGNPQSGRNEGI